MIPITNHMTSLERLRPGLMPCVLDCPAGPLNMQTAALQQEEWAISTVFFDGFWEKSRATNVNTASFGKTAFGQP